MLDRLNAAEFEQRVNQMSERLDALRGTPRGHAGHGPSLPYVGLDLSAELEGLAPILSTLIHQDPGEPVTHNARLEVAGRRLALAALMALVAGGEGFADFAARYQVVMTEEPNYGLFERVLPNAMREAGLPLPAKLDGRRMLEALQAAAGLPKDLVGYAARYFIGYWRWFHPCTDPLAPLAAIAAGRGGEYGLDAETSESFQALAGKLLPNSAAMAPIVAGLAVVMGHLRTQAKLRVGDLFDAADAIEAQCGVNPARLLLKQADALAALKAGLDFAWHPDQFRHVMTAFPRGSEVRLPNGSLAMVDKAVAVPHFGVYRIESKTYLVLPNEGLTLDAVKAWPEGKLHYNGNRAIWRGASEADVTADEWPQIVTPRALFEERAPLGFVYCHVPAPGRTLRIGAQTLAPQAGVNWRASLLAAIDPGGQPRLSARITGLRVCLPELAGKTLQLECLQAATAGRLTFDLDERGVGGLPDMMLAISTPGAGALEVFLQDHATGEVVEHAGKPQVLRHPLDEIVLFAEGSGLRVPPTTMGYPYGVASYLLFAARPFNAESLEAMDVGIKPLGKTGDYEVSRLSWRQPAQPLSIFLDPQHAWSFGYRLDAVWTGGPFPPPAPPLLYASETPEGYTLPGPDPLFVDDVSLVHEPLVVLAKDGQVLAAHTWDELNWMMNFPPDNRRFSGVMMRRALHVGPEFDLAGRYVLSLLAGPELLGEKTLTLLPTLDVRVTPVGPQEEDTTFTLTARATGPSFKGGLREVKRLLGAALVDREVMENSPFQPKALEAVLPLQEPPFDLRIALHPELIGFRLLDENEGTWVRRTQLSYAELSHITLVLFAANGEVGSLTVGAGETMFEDFYEGFATFSLARVKETLRSHETEVRFAVDGRQVGTLVVTWHPQILQFEAANEYLEDHKAQLVVHIEGPVDVPVRLEATAPDGRKLNTMELSTDEVGPQNLTFDVPASRDYPVVTVRAFVPTESSGISSGSVEVRNAAFDPEIEAINRRIAAEPRTASLRKERADLLLARGLRKAASRDFAGAVDLGMTELLDSPQYQDFMTQRRAESFMEDLKAIASFFVPFARKELNIG